MLDLLTSAQMKDLDARTINEFGIPARVLMETAGKGCADLLIEEYPELLSGDVCVLCGKGNNGGDGAVIARWLHQYGCDVNILRAGAGAPSPDAKANFDLCAALDIPLEIISKPEDLPLAEELMRGCSLVVDAVFGTGFKGRPEPFYEDLFALVNTAADFIVSVDIPSGLDADTGWCGEAIYADLTIAIESLKLGHITGLGDEACGDLHVVPIGIPNHYYPPLDSVKLFTDEDFQPPMRHAQSHKNDFGKVYVFGGIQGYTGASVMSAQAALRSGAGYVFVPHRPELSGLYGAKLTEALPVAIPQSPKTGLPDAKALSALLADAAAVLIGPGLGRDDYALKLLEFALKSVKVPLVVDADGLNLLAANPAMFKYLAKPNVLLTPHWGEFSRLARIPKPSLEKDCLGPLRKFAAEHGARILLKSHFSVYHDADFTWVSDSGNDGLATGGSGDVLSGIIASFLAQGLEIPDAAINASWLLGHTAELLSETRGTPSILPSDIIDNLFILED